jgi:hypothetical protein
MIYPWNRFGDVGFKIIQRSIIIPYFMSVSYVMPNTQNEFKGNAAVERAANDAAIKGDKRGARAIRDADELRKLQKDYKDKGMTAEQATADFTKSLVADAAGRSQNVVATSLQSIGGGGGFSAGGDPVRQAQERSLKAQQELVKLNQDILAALKGTAQ